MIWFFTIDTSIILAFVLLGILVFGGSVKAIAHFIVNEIHIVYPAFVAILALVLLIYYLIAKKNLKNEKGFAKIKGDMILARRMIVFIINSPLVILSPISAIYSLASFIADGGVGGFIIAFMMFFVFLLCFYLVFLLFLKAWEWADEKRYGFGKAKMFGVSIAFLFLQYILYIITSLGYE